VFLVDKKSDFHIKIKEIMKGGTKCLKFVKYVEKGLCMGIGLVMLKIKLTDAGYQTYKK